MSSFTSDQGPISSISESITGESYLLHAMASTLFCENCWYFRELGPLRANCGEARELRVQVEAVAYARRGLSEDREHRFCRRLLRSWRVAWLILECARPTRGVRDRALREHRRSSGSIPSSARAIPSTISFSRVAWSILDCARRTSTFLSCAFREQEDDQAALSLSHLRQLREVMRKRLHPA